MEKPIWMSPPPIRGVLQPLSLLQRIQSSQESLCGDSLGFFQSLELTQPSGNCPLEISDTYKGSL